MNCLVNHGNNPCNCRGFEPSSFGTPQWMKERIVWLEKEITRLNVDLEEKKRKGWEMEKELSEAKALIGRMVEVAEISHSALGCSEGEGDSCPWCEGIAESKTFLKPGPENKP